ASFASLSAWGDPDHTSMKPAASEASDEQSEDWGEDEQSEDWGEDEQSEDWGEDEQTEDVGSGTSRADRGRGVGDRPLRKRAGKTSQHGAEWPKNLLPQPIGGGGL
ncbi:MAG: hypothetical protein AAGA56_14950, partial [Myxococcota bacterium]